MHFMGALSSSVLSFLLFNCIVFPRPEQLCCLSKYYRRAVGWIAAVPKSLFIIWSCRQLLYQQKKMSPRAKWWNEFWETERMFNRPASRSRNKKYYEHYITPHLWSWHFHPKRPTVSAFDHVDANQKLQEPCKYVNDELNCFKRLQLLHLKTNKSLFIYFYLQQAFR